MSEEASVSRRHFLTVATSVTGVVGLALTAAPFIASFRPSTRAQALGAPVTVDISKLDEGAMVRVVWRGQPVWVLRRSKDMLERLAGGNVGAEGSGVERVHPARVRQERHAGAAAGLPGGDRQLHASRLRPAGAVRGGACRPRPGLGRRLLLPLPRFQVRPGGARHGTARRHPPTCRSRPIASWGMNWSSSAKTREPTHERGTYGAAARAWLREAGAGWPASSTGSTSVSRSRR